MSFENLRHEPYVSLETFRRSGQGVRTPVWVVGDDEHLYIFSAGEAGKVKRIRLNKTVRLAPCSYSGDIRGEWLPATARLVTDVAEANQVYRGFAAKYGWQYRLLTFFSGLAGKVRERALIEISA